MPRIQFSDRAVAALKFHPRNDGKDARVEYWSAGEPGFGIRVQETRKSWVYKYSIDERQRRKKLGEYPAVSLAKARRRMIGITKT